MGVGGPEAENKQGLPREEERHMRGVGAPESNWLRVHGRAQAVLAPPEAKILRYWMLLSLMNNYLIRY